MIKIFKLLQIACTLSFALMLAAASINAQTQPRSILLRGGTLIDGTGATARKVDVRIKGDRINAIGNLTPLANEQVIDVSGLTIAPGFVDIHNHSERGLAKEPGARSQILQGITTLAVGPDGDSPFPLATYLAERERQPTALNVAAFIGHATVRKQVMKNDFKRAATANEIAAMAKLVEQAMREGAVGLSSGLEYDIGNPSTTEEVIELAKVTARFGGIYMSHVRDEADDAFNAFQEALRIGRAAQIPVDISHIKLGTVSVWNKANQAIALIEQARLNGQDVTADCYPYDAWASTITVLVPSRKHDDPVVVKKGLDDVGGGDNVTVASCAAHPDYVGKTLTAIAQATQSTAVAVYQQIVKDGGASVICKSMIEADIRAFYQQPWVMVASDGGIGSRHPRGAGSFPRVLGRFVREAKWLTLTEAIRKMSAFPASRIGLRQRGQVQIGWKADLVVFDAQQIIDRATMTDPLAEPLGMQYVFVNGVAVCEAGQTNTARPGQVLRQQRSPRRNQSR